MTTQTPTTNGASLKSRRKLWLAGVGGAFAVIGAAYGVYWATVLRYSQSTDDAYVNGNVVQITPQISGTVVSIGADDTQFVKAGGEVSYQRFCVLLNDLAVDEERVNAIRRKHGKAKRGSKLLEARRSEGGKTLEQIQSESAQALARVAGFGEKTKV